MQFERWIGVHGVEVSTINLDHAGNEYEYDTPRTWQFEAYRRDADHLEDLWHNSWPKVAEANRADMPYRWSVSYEWSDSCGEVIADGFAESLDECEEMFERHWHEIRRHKVCSESTDGLYKLANKPFVDRRNVVIKAKKREQVA